MSPPPADRAIRSMTGYAEARSTYDGRMLRVSVKSVNHRFLDLRIRLAEGFEALEPVMRQTVRDRLKRGHVEVTLHVESSRAAAVQINRDVAATYLRAAEDLRREFGLEQQPDLIALLRLPGVVDAAGDAIASSEGDLGALGHEVSGCLEQALRHLDEMRRAEGKALAKEMRSLIAAIAEKTLQLEKFAERAAPAYAERLKERLAELLGTLSLDAARVAQEAALIAERADVSEELARLRSHLEQFGKLVDGEGEVGKKLDFLLQEMQREANTLLSKTPGLGTEGLQMTDLGLQIKADIEKLREQVQNVE